MTAFTSFAFAAAGGPVNGRSPVGRTMPARFNDIINVKDWGAKGDGITNDSAAINAAIEYAMFLNPSGHGGSRVYVPPGRYYVGANPIVLGKDWHGAGGGNKGLFILEGAARDASVIFGNYSGGGAVAHPAIATMDWLSGNYQPVIGIRNITFQNDSTAGGSMALTMENINQIIVQNCKFIGNCGFVYGDTFATAVINCVAICNQSTIPPDTVTAGGAPPGHASMGFCGYQTSFWGCYAEGFEYGFCPAGPGSSVIGCHAYRCTEGVDLGNFSVKHDASDHPLPGYGSGYESSVACVVMGNRFERCKFGIYTRDCTAPFVAGNIVDGPAGVTDTCFVALGALDKANVLANSFEVPCSGSAVYLPQGAFGQSTFASIVGPSGWWWPRNNQRGIYFINCGTSGTPANPNLLAAPVAFMTFSQLGDETTIIDATTATFGQAVTGGSNHRYKVRWNGANYIRVG